MAWQIYGRSQGVHSWWMFKNILSGERVKDIDISLKAKTISGSCWFVQWWKHQKEGWKFKYRNEKVCAFQKEGEKVWVEFIESEFGKPEAILRSFDFTVAKWLTTRSLNTKKRKMIISTLICKYSSIRVQTTLPWEILWTSSYEEAGHWWNIPFQ